MVVVRHENPSDQAAIRELLVSSFGDTHAADLADLLRASPSYDRDLAFVAEVDGSVVGYVMLSSVAVGKASRMLSMSPLAVHPAWQGRGIGRTLVEYSVSRADEVGEAAIVLEGDPRLYRRLGFVPAHEHGLLRPSPAVPEPAFQVLPLASHRPYMTGRVWYPPPYWAAGGAGLPEQVEADGPFSVPWLFEFARYAGWIESVATSPHFERPVPACPGWTVREVLRHLGTVHRVVRRWIDDGRRPVEVRSEPYDGDAMSWFATGWRELFDVLASAPHSEPAATWSPWDDTLGFWRRRMTHETAIHALDVLAAVPDHGTEWSAWPEVALDGIDEALRLWLGSRVARDVGGLGQIVEIHTRARAWTVGLHADIVEVHHLPTPADARVSGQPEAMYAWLWGRSEDVSLDGDSSAADTLRRTMAKAMQ